MGVLIIIGLYNFGPILGHLILGNSHFTLGHTCIRQISYWGFYGDYREFLLEGYL